MLTASHHRHRGHAVIEVGVQAGVLLFPNFDLESASEESDALNLKEHIFEVMEEILPEHVKQQTCEHLTEVVETTSQDQQQSVRKQTVDQIVNTHAPQICFPPACWCASASIF